MRAWLILLALSAVGADQQCPVLPGSYPPSATDLPLCGNGVLDAGETCDDGNRIGGDGCNAWCSQFDLFARPCTVAGRASSCPAEDPEQRPVLSTFAQSQFCSLTALTVSPDGTYAVLADGGSLVRMPLYQQSTALSLLSASVAYRTYKRFCFLHVMEDGDTLLAHECDSQQVILFTRGGTSLRNVATLSDFLRPTRQMRAHYDKGADELLVAGVPPNTADACVMLYAITVSTGAIRVAGAVPCVAYNVWEEGALYTSFAVEGMVPTHVRVEGCPGQMSSDMCYVVQMARGDMQQMQAYLPIAGGLDVQYTVGTDPTVNVLGAPHIVSSRDNANVYTLTGPCLSAQNAAMTDTGRAPPAVTLGNVCRLVAAHGWPCATPLNSPFNTDIVNSPYLLLSGLTSRHTHAQLVDIFFTNTTATLYAQILQNSLAGAVPLAMAEIPGTRDLLYVTATTVGLISTKGVVLNDPFNPGYCIPTRILQCPSASFGSVGGVCVPCEEADNSVAAQVQCLGFSSPNTGRRLLSSMQRPPYIANTHVVSSDVTKSHFDTLHAYLMLKKGLPCCSPDISGITAPQTFTMAADGVKSGVLASGLAEDLIARAQARTGNAALSMAVQDEYTVTWTTQCTDLIRIGAFAKTSLALNDTYLRDACPPGALMERNGSGIDGLADALGACDHLINRAATGRWMPCAVQALRAWYMPNATKAGLGRRLLAAATPDLEIVLVEQSQPTLYSDTAIYYYTPDAPSPSTTPSPPAAAESSVPGTTIIIAGAAGGVVGALLLVACLYACMHRRRARRSKRL